MEVCWKGSRFQNIHLLLIIHEKIVAIFMDFIKIHAEHVRLSVNVTISKSFI